MLQVEDCTQTEHHGGGQKSDLEEDDVEYDNKAPSEEYRAVVGQLAANQRAGMIGDWSITRCDLEQILLEVSRGHGASKKLSFINPDVSTAIR